MTLRHRLAAALLALAATACAPIGEFVWADAYQAAARPEGEYQIAAGDVLNVRVYGQENMSGRVKVRSDGRISLPFVNDQAVAGMTTAALAKALQGQYKAYVNSPVVSVSVEEQRPVQVSVVGEVAKPGIYRVEPGQGVLHALAQAGGLTAFASKDRIFVVRKAPTQADPNHQVRVRFKWQSLVHAEGSSASFQLGDGDVLVAE